MTREDFNNTRFASGMIALYQGVWHDIDTVNFHEGLFGLSDGVSDDPGDLIWIRCESVNEIKSK